MPVADSKSGRGHARARARAAWLLLLCHLAGRRGRHLDGRHQALADAAVKERVLRAGAPGKPSACRSQWDFHICTLQLKFPYAARSLCHDTGSPDYQGRGQGSGRIINQKRTNGQISRFGLRMAEPYKEFISGQAEPFLSRACRMATLSRPASRSGRFIKADCNFMPMAALSKLRTTPMAAMAVLSIRSGQIACWAADGRFHIVPHKQFINGQVEPF